MRAKAKWWDRHPRLCRQGYPAYREALPALCHRARGQEGKLLWPGVCPISCPLVGRVQLFGSGFI